MFRQSGTFSPRMQKEAIKFRGTAQEIGEASLGVRLCDLEYLVWSGGDKDYFEDGLPLPNIAQSGMYHLAYHRPGMSKAPVVPETLNWPTPTPSFRELCRMEEVSPDGDDVGQERDYTRFTHPVSYFMVSNARYGEDDHIEVAWKLPDPEFSTPTSMSHNIHYVKLEM